MLAQSFASALALVLSQTRERAARRRVEQERELLRTLELRLAGTYDAGKIGAIVAETAEKLGAWDEFRLYLRRPGNGSYQSAMVRFRDGRNQHENDVREWQVREVQFCGRRYGALK